MGAERRGPLGIYNFSGDLGKATLPALAAFLLPFLAWRPIAGMMAILGLAAVIGLLALARAGAPPAKGSTRTVVVAHRRRGFGLLMLIGALDTATRMGYLLFLPFLIHGRGGHRPRRPRPGTGLRRGCLGKATCNGLVRHLGVTGSVAGNRERQPPC